MWLQVQALQLPSFATLGELFYQSEPQFSHLQNGVKPIFELGGEGDIAGCLAPPLQILCQSELLFDFLFFDIIPRFILQPSRACSIFSHSIFKTVGDP